MVTACPPAPFERDSKEASQKRLNDWLAADCSDRGEEGSRVVGESDSAWAGNLEAGGRVEWKAAPVSAQLDSGRENGPVFIYSSSLHRRAGVR